MTHMVRLDSKVEIIEGEMSSTRKTISVDYDGESYRLDTETILSGDSEIRDSQLFELYSPVKFRQAQKVNKSPENMRGGDEVTPRSELPPPTHS